MFQRAIAISPLKLILDILKKPYASEDIVVNTELLLAAGKKLKLGPSNEPCVRRRVASNL
jgi:hypothetical protein